MKRLTRSLTAILSIAMAASALNSCIFDGPGDRFYRTLWTSDEVPLGPLSPNKLTLEFLCGQSISLKTRSASCTSHGPDSCTDYGKYDSDGLTATFESLTMTIDSHMLTFIHATRNGDTLYLNWIIDGSPDSFTTTMHRLSAYE